MDVKQIGASPRVGHLDSAESTALAGLIDKALDRAQQFADWSKPYWYPLCRPSYGTEEVLSAVDSLLRYQTTMSDKVLLFERRFAEEVNTKHAVMVNSGSSADLLICMALTMPSYGRLKKGDEVLIPALTWPTQLWSAVTAGLKVRTIDVEPSTFNTSPRIVEEAISEETKAMFVVHLLGNVCEMNEIQDMCRKRDIVLIEDCCNAFGSAYDGRSVGTFGLAGAFSFFFSHHMTTMEGGMVVTNDDRFADCLRVLRAHGWTRNLMHAPLLMSDCDKRFSFVDIGFNVRPTEIQGAFGLVQLKRQKAFTLSRRLKYEAFRRFISSVLVLGTPQCPKLASANWMLLAVIVKPNEKFTKQQLVHCLEEQGVETRPVSVGDVTKQPFANHYPFLRGATHPGVQQVDQAAFTIGLFPNSPGADPRDCQDIERVIGCLETFLRSRHVEIKKV